MHKKSIFYILLAFSVILLFQSQTENVKADQQSSYYDITIASNDNSDGNIAEHVEKGNEVTNGDNGGNNQVTKAPGTTATQANSQPRNILTGLLPQTSNEQEGLLLGVLILIIMLLGWIIYLLVEGNKGEKHNEKFN